MKRTRKKANLASIGTPQLVTLTKSPANQTGFKVMRSEEAGVVEEKVIRGEQNLISITLPAGITSDDADTVLTNFGLTEDYTVTETDGSFSLVRNASTGEEETLAIPMNGDGLIAHISTDAFLRSDTTEVEGETIDSVSLSTIRFDKTDYDSGTQVSAWLTEKGIECPQGGLVEEDDFFLVTRTELGTETKEITLATGITGTIQRADALDIPVALYGMTVEQAYGSWGWNQINFSAAIADENFTNKSWDAIYALRDVLENIVFYSDFDLETRKILIRNATSGYADYMVSLIDVLPTGVIEQARSDNNPDAKEAIMPKTKEDTVATTEPVTRTEEKLVEGAVVAPEAKDTIVTDDAPITRSELTGLIATAVAAAMTPAPAAEAAPAAVVAEVTRTDATVDPMVAMAAAMTALTESVGTIAGEVKTIRSDITEAEEGTTVARSDDTEGEGVEEDEPTQRSDVFSGMFRKTAG